MATTPITYRVSPEVDAELRRLAALHGGVDKALRVVLEWNDPNIPTEPANKILDQMQQSVDQMVAKPACPECGRKEPGHSMTCEKGNAKAIAYQQPERSFKGPLLRPKDKKK